MKTLISTLALVAGLSLAGASFAQPSGGADAKGNAPIKAVHTINDGTAKRGANSFTQGQARQHILNSGYTSVSPLTKGPDGVWRGTAMKGGASVNVGMDFKGNVSEGGAVGSTAETSATTSGSTAGEGAAGAPVGASTAAPGAGSSAMAHHAHHRMHKHHRHHWDRHHDSCTKLTPNGAACSGVDRNKNGISDKEDHALKQ